MSPTPSSQPEPRYHTLPALGGLFVAGVTAIVGLVELYEGLVRLNSPLIAVGASLLVMGGLLSLVLPDEMRRLARERHGGPTVLPTALEATALDFLAAGHRRRKIAFAITAIPLVLVLFLFGWSISSDGLRATVEGLAAPVFVIVILVLVVVYAALGVITDARFVLSDRGFVPRQIPVARALRRRHLIEFREVSEVIYASSAESQEAYLRLVDGTVIVLSEREGVPRVALDQLVEALKARGVSIHSRGSALGERSE